ncbi:related to Pheromone-regulated membrane protein 10 [Saccharomycodes ludwigii]|uniref:Pheromone-regulated membrane protein 10 n=1 Tax=Saccharomycodes ludwigii TaxID=36035 RepID=A0A376B585_9ASCO|nr:hypothetical protein SCDLUD_003650 [Saccharomycodes ludwigii]KAH3900654.1 hypothetical protein SCDLUD_003650 [Saccharomycodes ludwigii]SSD59857.1 related to Pheromone-regulated membrane protein 10 [Saccharomycodes ludwigii]
MSSTYKFSKNKKKGIYRPSFKSNKNATENLKDNSNSTNSSKSDLSNEATETNNINMSNSASQLPIFKSNRLKAVQNNPFSSANISTAAHSNGVDNNDEQNGINQGIDIIEKDAVNTMLNNNHLERTSLESENNHDAAEHSNMASQQIFSSDKLQDYYNNKKRNILKNQGDGSYDNDNQNYKDSDDNAKEEEEEEEISNQLKTNNNQDYYDNEKSEYNMRVSKRDANKYQDDGKRNSYSSYSYSTTNSSSSADNAKDAQNMNKDDDTEENKIDHFKQFFHRRNTIKAKEPNPTNSKEYDHGNSGADEEETDGISKFFNNTFGSNGLVPFLNNNSNEKSTDREDLGNSDEIENGIPLDDIKNTAQNIVKTHLALNNDSSQDHRQHSVSSSAVTNDDSNVSGTETDVYDNIASPHTTAYDGNTLNNSITNNDSAFFVNNAQRYDNENLDDDYDMLLGNDSYIERPKKVRGGILGSLLKLYQQEEGSLKSELSLNSQKHQTPSASEDEGQEIPENLKKRGKITFKTPYLKKRRNLQQQTISEEDHPNGELPKFKSARPKYSKIRPSKLKKKMLAEARITVHIADLLQRQRFILRMCKALMLYGAPTHRLEEYMIMTSRVLEIDGQFLYVPGCMIVSFGDATTRTSEVQLVRCNQGLNLWKLHKVHSIYKQVVHDLLGVAEANFAIDSILSEKNLYPPWICVLLYGIASAMVTPFSFGGDWINLAISFFIGSCVGFLQFVVSQRSFLYSNVFEVTASIVVSFCGRALGSIPKSNICFGAVVQGSLALILPGYIILCGSLELQSRNLVAGSVRMFYAIIYSLFLGFGITLGAALFGWLYKGASNETTCSKNVSDWYRFLFVPMFSICLGLINQARWIQLPVMTLISCTGYVVTYWSGKHFSNATEFTSAMAAFVIGILGNLYSRVFKGLAVSAILPAIFVQVPSGIASKSSLLSGVQVANNIVNSTSSAANESDLSSSMSFGVTMIEVSIGISVGLFASTLVVYPFGKKRTGLFTL